LIPINAALPACGHKCTMSAQIAILAAPKVEAIAERLLAHARLCEQIARECQNVETAVKLRRMAQDCAQAAAQLAPPGEPVSPTRH
jgi:hypothetical protein